MKTFKMIGYAGIASAALALVVSSLTIPEAAQARNTNEQSSVSLVHRVSHSLAADAQYTAAVVPSGYKWGHSAQVKTIRSAGNGSIGAASAEPHQDGYKWGKISASDDLSTQSNYVEQAANPWGRRDFSEQAANPWGRRGFSEQAANPWGRRDFSEQAANPWGRRDFSEQAANPWGRRDFSEQAANPWGRRDFSEQAANPWGRR